MKKRSEKDNLSWAKTVIKIIVFLLAFYTWCFSIFILVFVKISWLSRIFFVGSLVCSGIILFTNYRKRK